MPPMPRRPRGIPPPYLHHRGSGQAYSTVGGRPVYHGVHGSAESRRNYAEFVRRWEEGQAGQTPYVPPSGCTVEQMAAGYLDVARAKHADPEGRPGKEYESLRLALRELAGFEAGGVRLGTLPAAALGARDLKRLQGDWASKGRSPQTVNQMVGRVRRAFRWAVAEELVPASTLVALAAVPRLEEEDEPVPPAPIRSVAAAMLHSPPALRAMMRLQWLVGMRPGEACRLAAAEVALDGVAEVRTKRGLRRIVLAPSWAFQPGRHKTRRRGKNLVYALGPRARALLRPFLENQLEGPVFRTARGRGWTPDRYGKEVAAALARANAARAALGLAPVEAFSPNQLRHSFVTRADAAVGLERASKMVGHASLATSEIYIERELGQAAADAEQLG